MPAAPGKKEQCRHKIFQDVGKYSIKDIENLSGIKAHTIRIWEQRYKLVKPKRTETNIRFYTDEQLIYLLNISSLNKNGYKISHIAQMTGPEISAKANQLDSNGQYEKQVNDMVVAMIEMDEKKFEKSISTNILQFGFEKTMIKNYPPFSQQDWQPMVFRSHHPCRRTFYHPSDSPKVDSRYRWPNCNFIPPYQKIRALFTGGRIA